MAVEKIGLNLSVFKDVNPPNITITNSTSGFMDSLVNNANTVTNNFFGLGFMSALFLFLVWKIGEGIDIMNERYSNLRSVGISAGIVSMIGIQFLSLGYFTVYYHAVIFIGILLVCVIWVFLEDRR